MINQCTIDKLIEMCLTVMANAFRIQIDDPAMKGISFKDRFGMLVGIEYINCKNNRLKRLIRNSRLEQSCATIAGVDYTSGGKPIGEEGWYERLGGDDNLLTDAIMDRIIYDAYKINIESIDSSKDLSMREVYALYKNQAQ